jgi:catechol 2,3-dioxygenase-like lactoylglutathione lyase family enzyme
MFRIATILVAMLSVSILVLTAAPAGAQASSSAAASATPDLGLTAAALNVSDLARSEKFYIDFLGLERTFRYPPEGKLLEVGLSRPGSKLASSPAGVGQMTLILAHFNDDPLPEGKARYGRIVVVTADAQAVAKRATDAGGQTRTLSAPQGGGPVVIFVTDPDGYQIELYQPAAPAAAPSAN